MAAAYQSALLTTPLLLLRLFAALVGFWDFLQVLLTLALVGGACGMAYVSVFLGLSQRIRERDGSDNWESEQVCSIPGCQLRWFGALPASLYRRIRGSVGWRRVANLEACAKIYGTIHLALHFCSRPLPVLKEPQSLIFIRLEHGVYVRCNFLIIGKDSIPVGHSSTLELGPPSCLR